MAVSDPRNGKLLGTRTVSDRIYTTFSLHCNPGAKNATANGWEGV